MKKLNPLLLIVIVLILSSCSVFKKIEKNMDSNYRDKNHLPPKGTNKQLAKY